MGGGFAIGFYGPSADHGVAAVGSVYAVWGVVYAGGAEGAGALEEVACSRLGVGRAGLRGGLGGLGCPHAAAVGVALVHGVCAFWAGVVLGFVGHAEEFAVGVGGLAVVGVGPPDELVTARVREISDDDAGGQVGISGRSPLSIRRIVIAELCEFAVFGAERADGGWVC